MSEERMDTLRNMATMATAVTATIVSGPTTHGDMPDRVCMPCASQPLTALEMTTTMGTSTAQEIRIIIQVEAP